MVGCAVKCYGCSTEFRVFIKPLGGRRYAVEASLSPRFREPKEELEAVDLRFDLEKAVWQKLEGEKVVGLVRTSGRSNEEVGCESLPKTKREEVAALITLLALIEGVFFDTRDLRRLPYQPETRQQSPQVTSGVECADEDTRQAKLRADSRVPRDAEARGSGEEAPCSGIHQFPSLDVFYVGGMEDWSEHEFEVYVGGMRDMWQSLSRNRTPARRS